MMTATVATIRAELGVHCQPNELKQAGKILKAQGEETAREYLRKVGKGRRQKPLRPPTRNLIVATSRAPEEMPFYMAVQDIQRFYREATLEMVEALGKPKDETSRRAFFQKTGIDDRGIKSAQGFNINIDYVHEMFKGVIKKVENRNKKRQRRREERGLPKLEAHELETALDEAGRLRQPFGLNPTLIGFQGMKLQPYDPKKHQHVKLPSEYDDYRRDPDAPIARPVLDRCIITEGQPGYIPEWQRASGLCYPPRRELSLVVDNDGTWGPVEFVPQKFNSEGQRIFSAAGAIASGLGDQAGLRKLLSRVPLRPSRPELVAKDERGRRLRLYGTATQRANAALLAYLDIPGGSDGVRDYVIVDMRGLLRNAHWRRVVTRDMTLTELLNLVSQDPVLHFGKGTATLLYRTGVLAGHSAQPVAGFRTKLEIERLLTEHGTIGLAGVDLGVTNEVAVAATVLAPGDVPRHVGQMLLTPELKAEVTAFRRRWDLCEVERQAKAIRLLTSEQQSEIATWKANNAAEARRRLCDELEIPRDAPILWDEMTSSSTLIAHYLLRRDERDERAYCTALQKQKGRPKRNPARRLKFDRWFATDFGAKLSEQTRSAEREMIHKVEREDPSFAKLATRRKELLRRVVNVVEAWVRQVTGCEIVAIAIEDLEVKGGFFDQGGARPDGWDHYFKPKLAKGSFIKQLKGAFRDLAPHRGVIIFMIDPRGTSIKCIQCGSWDKNNRKGENFRCLNCGYCGNADLDVATWNILNVARTGKRLLKHDAAVESEAAE